LTCGCGKPLRLTRVYQADEPGKNTRIRAALSMLGRCKEPWCVERMHVTVNVKAKATKIERREHSHLQSVFGFFSS
jgi:hypothetical protein